MLERLYSRAAAALAVWLYRPQYRGFGHIPPIGAGVLVCNHVAYVDGLVIHAGLQAPHGPGRPVRFVIDAHIYHLPFIHHIMQKNRAIPILANRQSVQAALDAIAAGLAAGDLIGIFPEGQLTYTGGLGRFKTGIEAILKRMPVPVYPVAITGLWGSWFSRKYHGTWRRFLPRRRATPVRVTCGPAIAPGEASVNLLQETVLRLKYQENAPIS